MDHNYDAGTPADQLALRDLITQYGRGVDRRDLELLRSLFAADAQLDFGEGHYVGALDGFLDHVRHTLSRFQITQHHMTSSLFRFGGDRAEGETYLVAYHVMNGPDAGMFIAGARYLDRFRRIDGMWKISHRTTVQDWAEPSGIVKGVRFGKVDATDPSYTRLEMFAPPPKG